MHSVISRTGEMEFEYTFRKKKREKIYCEGGILSPLQLRTWLKWKRNTTKYHSLQKT